MSLYVYAVVVSDDEADRVQKYLEHMQSQPLRFNEWGHDCYRAGCRARFGLPDFELYGPKSLGLGRPMYVAGSGEMEAYYGKQKLEGEFLRALIHSCLMSQGSYEGADDNWITWIERHVGRTVVVVNDNEF